MRARLNAYSILAGICALLVLLTLWETRGQLSSDEPYRIDLMVLPADLCVAVAIFFVIPAAVRTLRPQFNMTILRVLGVIGIGLAVTVAVEIGLLLLIVPGIWVGVKLSQATWTYLIADGKNPFGESWEITTGHFWESLAFFVLLAIVTLVAEIFLVFFPLAIAYYIPAGAVVFVPAGFLGYVYVCNVSLLGQMRWMLELRGLNVPAPRPSAGS